jgi:hypothetical protein
VVGRQALQKGGQRSLVSILGDPSGLSPLKLLLRSKPKKEKLLLRSKPTKEKLFLRSKTIKEKLYEG